MTFPKGDRERSLRAEHRGRRRYVARAQRPEGHEVGRAPRQDAGVTISPTINSRWLASSGDSHPESTRTVPIAGPSNVNAHRDVSSSASAQYGSIRSSYIPMNSPVVQLAPEFSCRRLAPIGGRRLVWSAEPTSCYHDAARA